MFNSKKEAGRDAYFCLLGYSALFAPRSKTIAEAVGTKRTQEMKEAFNKVFKNELLRNTRYFVLEKGFI